MSIQSGQTNKRDLTETDIRSKFVTPAIKQAGWDDALQIGEEVYFTKGRIIVRGRLVSRGKAKKADYVLYFKPNIPIALVEAKDNRHSLSDGIQQGLEYAATLNVPFVFSSNGHGFVFHDRTGQCATVETNLGLDAFPQAPENNRELARTATRTRLGPIFFMSLDPQLRSAKLFLTVVSITFAAL